MGLGFFDLGQEIENGHLQSQRQSLGSDSTADFGIMVVELSVAIRLDDNRNLVFRRCIFGGLDKLLRN